MFSNSVLTLFNHMQYISKLSSAHWEIKTLTDKINMIYALIVITNSISDMMK